MSLVPCYRGSVNAWECDENDHLNVRFYLAKTNQGLPFALDAIGLPAAALARIDAHPRIRAQHVRFLKEARPATPLTVYAGLAEHQDHQLTLYAEVRHSLDGEVMATLLTEIGFAGADGRPRAVSPSGDAPRCTVPAHGAPRGIKAVAEPLRPDYASVCGMGFVEIGRGSIAPWECDPAGEMELFQYVGRINDSVTNLFAHFQTGEDRLARETPRREPFQHSFWRRGGRAEDAALRAPLLRRGHPRVRGNGAGHRRRHGSQNAQGDRAPRGAAPPDPGAAAAPAAVKCWTPVSNPEKTR